MRSTEEMLEFYKQELRRYVTWSDMIETLYPEIKERGIVSLSSGNYQESLTRDARLRGMSAALGLTPKEEAQIDEECGVRRS